jgi:hypothetical protein
VEKLHVAPLKGMIRCSAEGFTENLFQVSAMSRAPSLLLTELWHGRIRRAEIERRSFNYVDEMNPA